MAHASLKLIPGVDQNRTPALNEAGISTSQLVRFVPDRQGLALVQKLGGWTKYIAQNIGSKVRALWGWADIDANNYLAVGAERSLNIIEDGVLTGITPTTFSDSSAVKFETTVGTNVITVTDYGNTFAVTGATGDGTNATISFYDNGTGFQVGSYIQVEGIDPAGYNGTYTVVSSTNSTVTVANATASAVVTGASGTGTTVTLTYSGAATFTIGTDIVVTGIAPAAYNGTYTVTGSSAGSVSFASTTSSTYVSGGVIAQKYVSGGTIFNGGIVTGASGTGTTATVTFSGTLEIPVGASVYISGIDPAGYNGEYTVTGSSPGSIDFASAETAAYVSGGKVYLGNNTPQYTGVFLAVPVSVGGLTLRGFYEASPVDQFRYVISATNTLGAPQNALWSTVTAPEAVTGASGTGSPTDIATLTFTGPYTFPQFSGINVTEVDPNGYNGSYIVTGSTTTSVSYSNPTTAAYVSGGFIDNYGNVPLISTVADSSQATVTLPNHDFIAGGSFPVFTPIVVGGITIPPGSYTVSSVISSYSFQIGIPVKAATTDDVYMNNNQAMFVYYVGGESNPTGSGYGLGLYGQGAYGTYSSTGTTNYGGAIQTVDWSLDNLGSLLVACPYGGPIFIWDPTSNPTVPQTIGSGPPANNGAFVAMPQRQIIAWGSSFDGIVDPLLIRYCDVLNYKNWIGTVVNQAGSIRVPKGSRIVGALQGPQQGIIWTDVAVWAMQYVGPPLIYSLNEIGTGCGLIGRKAAATLGNQIFWMSQSQFYTMGEGGPQPVPCPIWDVIFQDLDTNNLDKIRAAANSRFGEVTWYYPTLGNGGEVSHYVKYNAYLQTWDFGQLGRTAWINQSVLGAPIGAGSDNFIYQHETSQNADGQAMLSSFQTGYFALDEADLKVFVDQVWPDMKWGYYGGSQNATVYITFFAADYAGQTPRQYGPFTMTQGTEFVTPRMRGRLVSIKIESNDLDSFWRIGNIRYRTQPDGKY